MSFVRNVGTDRENVLSYEPSSGRLSSYVVAMWQGRTSSRGGDGSLTLTLTLALALTLGVE
jgi:hypothetical protein